MLILNQTYTDESWPTLPGVAKDEDNMIEIMDENKIKVSFKASFRLFS